MMYKINTETISITSQGDCVATSSLFLVCVQYMTFHVQGMVVLLWFSAWTRHEYWVLFWPQLHQSDTEVLEVEELHQVSVGTKL